MPPWMAFDLLLLCLASAGHIALGVGLFNQMNSSWLPPHWVHKLERIVMLMTAVLPAGVGASLCLLPADARGEGHFLPKITGAPPWSWLWLYLAPCSLFGLLAGGRWLWNRLAHRLPMQLVHCQAVHSEAYQDHSDLDGTNSINRWLARIPGNEALRLTVVEKRFQLPRWPRALDHFRIVHLSDLHINGRISRGYFRRAITLVRNLAPDMVVISGDICECDECIPWLDDFGAMNAAHGAFFVLGNHDLRVSQSNEIRNRLAANGLVDLGGRWIIHEPKGIPVIMAGNELPWFAPAAPMERCPTEIDGQRPPRMVVSHSPDQYIWARSFDADLMLAGHTHGGQIRLPWIGPLVAPSRFGVKYASGEFYEAPTLMHVSRGLSSLQPLRFGCPPEIALLEIKSAEAAV